MLFITACKKTDSRKAILAGKYDSDLNFYKFDPDFRVDLVSDSVDNFKSGTDSIDIDQDGSYDLIVQLRIYESKKNDTNLKQEFYPFCNLMIKNGLEVATRTETYYIGLGQTSYVNWTDTIPYQNRIDGLTNWSGTDVNRWMWGVPPTSFWGSYGCWYNLVDADKYIGIRMKNNSEFKYGWIKVHQISRHDFSFVSYAIEN